MLVLGGSVLAIPPKVIEHPLAQGGHNDRLLSPELP